MNNIIKGLIAGTVFGIVSIIPMVFMTFEDKSRAMTASFISRFAIGFVIFNLDLPMPNWIKGGLVGLVLSLPDAIVTKTICTNSRTWSDWWHSVWALAK
ncbi:MAG: hypothetical protein IPJ54_18720 [Saprospiraceae bacterium]|nr:hypothetical protein [Saprospiraceae bacterium]